MKTLFCVALAALLVGCSDSGGGKKSDKDAKKPNINSKISNEGKNALTAQSAIFDTTFTQASQKSEKLSGNAKSVLASAAMEKVPQARAEKDAKAAKIRSAISGNDCKVNFDTPKTEKKTSQGAAANFPDMKIKIAGPSCPMELSFNSSKKSKSADFCVEQDLKTICKFDATVAMTYRVLDKQLQEELGVTQGQVSMSFEVEDEMAKGGMDAGAMGQNQKVKAAVKMEALDLLGHKHMLTGSADISSKMDMSFSEGEMTLPQQKVAIAEKFDYLNEATQVSTSLSAKIKVQGNKEESLFLVDGVEVTYEAYTAEREKFSNAMIGMEKDQSKSEEGPIDEEAPQPPVKDPKNPSKPQPPVEDPTTPPTKPEPPVEEPTNPNPPVGEPGQKPPMTACMMQSSVTEMPYIGYGFSNQVAEFKARQSCQQDSGETCNYRTTCDTEKPNETWFCEANNPITERVFGGKGKTRVEARYFALLSCINESKANTSACRQNLSKCSSY